MNLFNYIKNMACAVLGAKVPIKRTESGGTIKLSKITYILMPGYLLQNCHYLDGHTYAIKYTHLNGVNWQRQPTTISPHALNFQSEELTQVLQLCKQNGGKIEHFYN